MAGYGVDPQLTYLRGDALTLSFTGDWNNMEYTRTTPEHNAGDRAVYVPRYTASASTEYRFDLASLPSFARVDYQVVDGIQVYFRNCHMAPAKGDVRHYVNVNAGGGYG